MAVGFKRSTPMDYTVTSRQTEPHRRLLSAVVKHWHHADQRPIAQQQLTAFALLEARVALHASPIILDSGCGSAMSTTFLGAKYPDHLVIGLDKSSYRLQKAAVSLPNVYLLRCDVIDLWRLIAKAAWPIVQHYILYPNPWPKPKHLLRRFHAHPCFPALMSLSPYTQLRSNWRLYLQEFELACQQVGFQKTVLECYDVTDPMTAFERKYQQAGQQVYRLEVFR